LGGALTITGTVFQVFQRRHGPAGEHHVHPALATNDQLP
jgi:hypothetical protein